MNLLMPDKRSTLKRHKDFVRGMPLQESETVQTGIGQAVFETNSVVGKSSLVSFMAVKPEMSISILPEYEWVAILMTMSASSDLKHNGRAVTPDNLYVTHSPNGYITSGSNRVSWHAGFFEPRFRSCVAARLGVMVDEVKLEDWEFRLSPAAKQKLRQMLFSVLQDAQTEEFGGGAKTMTATRENDLICAFAGLVASYLPAVEKNYGTSRSATEIVRLCEAALRDPIEAPSLSDLCKLTQVSERWLRKCFVEIYGVPPTVFIKKRRLNLALDKLSDPQNPPNSVKEVSLSLGFWGSGRFAAEYRFMFGENPQDTLEKAQRAAC